MLKQPIQKKAFNPPLVSIVFILMVALVTFFFQGQTTAYAAASPTWQRCTTWNRVPSPNVGTKNNILNGIAAISTKDAWAVGYYGSGRIALTLIEHWNGKSWNVVASPNAKGSVYNELVGIAALSAKNIWAVGYYTTSNNQYPLIEHWNGKSWSIVSSPAPSSTSLRVISAISATDIWAVGSGLIEHWNGKSWSIVPNPGSNGGFSAIAAISSNSVWAVGVRPGPQGGALTLIEHWNGKNWSVVKSPSPGLINILSGITAISANNVWAVGTYADSFSPHAADRSLIEHWNGKSWSLISSPLQGFYDHLQSITAISARDIWVVGYYTDNDPAGGLYTTLTEHWDGSAWHVVKSPSPGSLTNSLLAVTHIPATKSVWAAGFIQNEDLAFQTLTIFHC